MHDSSISTSRLLAAFSWAITLLLLIAAWCAQYLLANGELAQLIGYTACAASAVSAVAHIRAIAVRSVRHIVLAVNSGSASDLRSMH